MLYDDESEVHRAFTRDFESQVRLPVRKNNDDTYERINDLIIKCLQKKAQNRYNIEQVLKHEMFNF